MNRTCNNCGWVHFGVSKEHVQKWEDEWKELCLTKPEEWLACYGIKDRTPPSSKLYYECFLCRGSYKNFRESQPEDCPGGCTIQPILFEE